MEDDEIKCIARMLEMLDEAYEEECRNRVNIVVPFAIVWFLLITAAVVVSILYCIFG